MISAAAILISGIISKHSALADRLRALAQEYRLSGTPSARRAVIRLQTELFFRRIRYTAVAHSLLYVSVCCFVGMVMVIALAPRTPLWDTVGLGEFVAGITLMLVSMAAELAELFLAGRTIRAEVEDVIGGDPPSERLADSDPEATS